MTIWKRLSLKKMRLLAVSAILIAVGVSGLGSVSYYFVRNKVMAHMHLCAPDDEIFRRIFPRL